MELNGARSNRQLRVELARLSELHRRLLGDAAKNPRQPRPAPAKTSPVLETVTRAYVVRSERARMLTTIIPAGLEELFVACGVPVTGAEPPTEAVLPPIDEMVRLFAGYGCEILGPPPSLSDLS